MYECVLVIFLKADNSATRRYLEQQQYLCFGQSLIWAEVRNRLRRSTHIRGLRSCVELINLC
jgi:hypothetical protein